MTLDHTFWQEKFPTLALTNKESWTLLMEAVTNDAQQVAQNFFRRLPNSSQKGIDILLDTIADYDKSTKDLVIPWLNQLGQQLLEASPALLGHFLTLTCKKGYRSFNAGWGIRAVIKYLTAQPINTLEAHLTATEPSLMADITGHAMRFSVNLCKNIWSSLVFPVQQRVWDDCLSPVTIQFIGQFNSADLLRFIGCMGGINDNESVKTFYHCLMTTSNPRNQRTLLHGILENKKEHHKTDAPNIQLLIHNIDQLYPYDSTKKNTLFDILYAKELCDLDNAGHLRFPSPNPTYFLSYAWPWFESSKVKFKDIFVARIQIKLIELHLASFEREYSNSKNRPELIRHLAQLPLDQFVKYLSIVGLSLASNGTQRSELIKNYMNAHLNKYVASEVITKFSESGLTLTDEDEFCIFSTCKTVSNQVKRRAVFGGLLRAPGLNWFNYPSRDSQSEELLLKKNNANKDGYGAVPSGPL